MTRYEFTLRISPEAYLDYYRGVARVVIVPTTSGERLQFPAQLLRPFVSEGGIEGRFVLLCDANGKCVDLRRVVPSP
jgi:hypothetical protein